MRMAVAISLLFALSACDSPSLRINELQFGSSKTLATTGNLRLVTERLRTVSENYPALPTVCTEPSPDYAIAFGQKADGNVKVTLPEGSGEGGLKLETSEQATALAGRTAGVLALRDGLFAACQAYANGTIGHNAYAIILSQYGTLLVALTSPNSDVAAAGRGDPGRRATLAALLVSCLTEYDRTRLASQQNPLLDPQFCKTVLRSSLAHGTSRI